MTGRVRTVTGDVDAEVLGVVDAHDHLFLASPALAGQELDAIAAAREEAASFALAGGTTLVQWTPAGLSCSLATLEEISRATGVRIVAATGRHREMHYAVGHPVAAEDEVALAARFARDVTEYACGLVKVGTGVWGPSTFERTSLAAAAAAHAATGVPVAVHLERGTGALEVMAALTADGVPPEHVLLGHLGRFPDPFYVADAAATGAWCSFDLPSPAHAVTDWRLTGLLAELVAAGRADQLLLGGDTVTPATRAEGSLGARWLAGTARLGRALGDAVVTRMTVDNPARALRVAGRVAGR